MLRKFALWFLALWVGFASNVTLPVTEQYFTLKELEKTFSVSTALAQESCTVVPGEIYEDRDSVRKRNHCLGPSVFPMAATSLSKRSDGKVDVKIQWNAPPAGQQVSIDRMVDKLQIHFRRYTIYRNDTEIGRVEDYNATSYTDVVTPPNEGTETYTYKVTATYQDKTVISWGLYSADGTADPRDLIINSKGGYEAPTLTQTAGKLGPFLQKPTTTFSGKNVTLGLTWRRPTDGAPNGTPKYEVRFFKQGTRPGADASTIKTNGSSEQVVSEQAVGAVETVAGGTVTYSVFIQANWQGFTYAPEDGQSLIYPITVTADKNGNITNVSVGDAEAAPDDSDVSRSTFEASAQCDCNVYTDEKSWKGDWGWVTGTLETLFETLMAPLCFLTCNVLLAMISLIESVGYCTLRDTFGAEAAGGLCKTGNGSGNTDSLQKTNPATIPDLSKPGTGANPAPTNPESTQRSPGTSAPDLTKQGSTNTTPND